MQSTSQTLLVIPCYNEEDRLPLDKFVKAAENMTILFSDDGSTDGTQKLLDKDLHKNIHYYRLPQNSGKAEAVRQGIEHALTLPNIESFKWIGFFDADLATPLEEVPLFLKYSELFPTDSDAIFGSRIYKLGSKIERKQIRHILGRLFATVIKMLFDFDSYDSQCGAKLFKLETAKEIFKDPFISKWIFDVEILHRLKNKKIIEYPVSNWVDIGGSKIDLGGQIFKVISDLLKIRKRYK